MKQVRFIGIFLLFVSMAIGANLKEEKTTMLALLVWLTMTIISVAIIVISSRKEDK